MMIYALSQPISEDIIEYIHFNQLATYVYLSSLVIYLHFYVSTLDNEISLMWKARFGMGKFLFYSLRYLTLLVIVFMNIGL
ncbi:hypothetical protein PNOK_0829400 [Pyrrhoderma noxium]|uniref:DUF6533 domain-containing protein n=1 Tax=Pyrrhoderma noxium TaxID=2282107 RepID=A0A286UAX5_9AGAM|nr:hypothetical protein PNOK_0829400 [Pyrrhoderma noxium]